MPRYPVFPSQPMTGDLPGLVAMGPPDLLPSSSTAPLLQARIDRMYGRHLAGIGEVQDELAQPEWSSNELKLLEEADDVRGNGVFDPPGTTPNTYADAGVFGGRYGLPGYIDREKFYKLSEVIDATTGRNVVYVPGGAVSMDSAAQVSFIEGGRYAQPEPVTSPNNAHRLRQVQTWYDRQNPIPITGSLLGDPPFGLTWNQTAMVAALVGLAGTVAYMTLKKPVRANRRRKHR